MATLTLWVRKNYITITKISAIVFIVAFSSYQKYKVFDETSGELNTFSSATMDFLEGRNPYFYTVLTFERPDLYRDHGYSYFPSYIFLYTAPLLIHENFNLPIQRLWKAEILLADIGVSYLIFKILYKKSFWATLLSIAVWSYNPYMLINNSYSYTEPLGIFFMLLGLMYLGVNDIFTGLYYAAAISFKAFPMVMFPLFLIKSKNKFKFLGAGAFFAFLMSIPFLRSIPDFVAYIKGSFLVHSGREPQGRPVLFFIKYYTALPLFNLKNSKLYIYLATFGGWVLSGSLALLKKTKSKYFLAFVSMIPYFLFTPYLARTHLIWILPLLCVGLFDAIYKKNKTLYFLLIILFYFSYAWYLSIWTRGVRVFGDFISL